MEITWRVISGGVGGKRGGKGTENKQHEWQVEDRQGEVKNGIGNVEAKELIYMTHRHELRAGEECWWGEGCRAERNKGEKKMGQL